MPSPATTGGAGRSLRASGLDFADLLDVEAAEALLLASARRPDVPPRAGRRAAAAGALHDAGPDGGRHPRRRGRRGQDRRGGRRWRHPGAPGPAAHLAAADRLLPASRARAAATPCRPTPTSRRPAPGGSPGTPTSTTCWSSSRPGTRPGTWPVWAPSPPSPGDVLYLPAHTEHSAEAQGEVSLHITIGILRVTYGHVLRRLLDRLDGVDLDAPLPVGFAAPDRSDALHDELTRHLREVAAAVGADRRARRRAARAPPGDPLALAPSAAGSSSRSSCSTRIDAVDGGGGAGRSPGRARRTRTVGGWRCCSSIARWRCRRRRERRSSTCFAARTRRWASSPTSATPAARSSCGASSGKGGSASSIPDRPARAPMLARWARTSERRSR